MKAEAEQKVFDRFFSVRNDEIRAGLGFCRLALINLGGAISCKSVEGEYTLFTIELPAS
jgi:signal transduction histidine kinase